MAEKEPTYRASIKKMPRDIRNFILREQNEIKINKGIQFSIESTILKLLYTHPKFNDNATSPLKK